MSDKLEQADAIIQAGYKSAKASLGRSQIDAIHLCIEGYAEPGYMNPESEIIAFGNWNRVTKYKNGSFVTIDAAPDHVAEKLQKLGVELEWSDEWDFCKGCGKAFRIKPSSYSWQQHSVDDGCGTTICGKCVEDDPANYLRCLEGHDPAVHLCDALADASRKMNAIDGQIKVATCDLSTGTATVRSVTPQEFVDGKALRS